MKAIFITLSTLFILVYGQHDFGYNPKNISIRTKNIIIPFKNAKRVEGEMLGRAAKPSKLYPHFISLMNFSNPAELIELTRHPSIVTRYYAFMALSYRKTGADTIYSILLEHILDTITVETQFGCLGSKHSIFERILSSFTFSDYIKPSIAQLKTIDSIIESNNIFYMFYPVTSDTLRNQVRKNIEPDVSKWRYYPLVRHQENFPLKMSVHGKVVDLSLGISCGRFCGCGTIKILLDKKIDGYEYGEVFVGINCAFVQPDWLNKKISIRLKALLPSNSECFWSGLNRNLIDSKGVPFYIPDDGDLPWIFD